MVHTGPIASPVAAVSAAIVAEQGEAMMGAIADMATIAAECIRTPGRTSVWSKAKGKYVCSLDQGFTEAVAENLRQPAAAITPPINKTFKLVFVTAFAGTIFFALLCVVTSLLAGRTPTPLVERVVMTIADMAKIGTGAFVGLLGGQRLRAESN